MSRDKNLVCYGCAHSAANVNYPGCPSGERPCCFCIRNPKLPKNPKDFIVNCWYNKSPAVSLPMDCYHSIDMLEQMELWDRLHAKGK